MMINSYVKVVQLLVMAMKNTLQKSLMQIVLVHVVGINICKIIVSRDFVRIMMNLFVFMNTPNQSVIEHPSERMSDLIDRKSVSRLELQVRKLT